MRETPPTTPPKSDLLGGIVLCALPAAILFAMRLNGVPLPMPWPVIFGVFFVYGVRSLLTSLFGLDRESPASWAADAIGAAGLAFFAFWTAWYETGGWEADLPILPHGLNQNLGRILFASGGLLATLFTLRCLWKAVNQFRNKPDDGITHV